MDLMENEELLKPSYVHHDVIDEHGYFTLRAAFECPSEIYLSICKKHDDSHLSFKEYANKFFELFKGYNVKLNYDHDHIEKYGIPYLRGVLESEGMVCGWCVGTEFGTTKNFISFLTCGTIIKGD